jgi:hypothetical protein
MQVDDKTKKIYERVVVVNGKAYAQKVLYSKSTKPAKKLVKNKIYKKTVLDKKN